MMARDGDSPWTDGEVTALIAIWGGENRQWHLDRAIRNIKVYEKLAATLTALEQCREKQQYSVEKVKKAKT